MPIKSYFAGFTAPTNKTKWKQSIAHAINGTQLLLKQVQKRIGSHEEVLKGIAIVYTIYQYCIIPLRYTYTYMFTGDIDFRWLHRQADLFIEDITLRTLTKFLLQSALINTNKNASIVFYGYQDFSESNFKGEPNEYHSGHIEYILNEIKNNQFKLYEKIVLMGGMNENWGFLSSHVLNRTWYVS